MRLINFEITSWVELFSGGLNWDLHNFADFDGAQLIPGENAAEMTWRATSLSNPWGSRENRHAGLKLYFGGLEFLSIGPRDEEMPMTEDTCVSHILWVTPNNQTQDPFMRRALEVTDDARLVFQFQSQRLIEIGSATVELIPLTHENLRRSESR